MRRQVTVQELIRQTIALARSTRTEIERAGLPIADFSRVTEKFGIQLEWGELPNGEDGSYSKDERKIILDTGCMSQERINFSFCHELIHDCIEHDDDLLSLFADAHILPGTEYETMERLCNAGAAELLMPSEDVRQIMLEEGFSTSLIPELCERFTASSVAVAFQMVNCASHNCYLVIAENRIVHPNTTTVQQSLMGVKSIAVSHDELVIIYSGKSSSAKYSIKRNQVILPNHLLCAALHINVPIAGRAKLPFASGNGWEVSCEALYYRGKVFAFFNTDSPLSNLQRRLFD